MDTRGPTGVAQVERPALCLDFLVEEAKPLGRVTLAGIEYDLMSMDVVEDMMRLVAVCERAKAAFEAVEARTNSDDPGAEVERMTAVMGEVSGELRGMIRVLVPGLTDEVLKAKFPRVGQLLKVFTALVMEVQRQAPGVLKKNSDGVMSGG